MQTLDRIYGFYQKLKGVFLFLGGVALFGMMFYITVDVLVRNFSPTALVGTYEIVSYYLMPLIILPSMCYALSSGVMPRIVAVTNKLSPRGQRVMGIILPILDLFFCVVMAFFSTRYAVQATADKLTFVCGVKTLPVYQMYFLAGLAYIMMSLENVFVLIRNLATGSSDILYVSNRE